MYEYKLALWVKRDEILLVSVYLQEDPPNAELKEIGYMSKDVNPEIEKEVLRFSLKWVESYNKNFGIAYDRADKLGLVDRELKIKQDVEYKKEV